ncbi:bifunctional folylpolyglutamate synthase/dihydrofolate synthase [Alkaliphilus transvaalensis]|uniref:bifunctional folylpolyglutamate synthase/dihydrofolate synthase n=1 Tax=Alkaliphilus transvaalensis TaxID=114628 RepID=UPI00047A3DFD|nr:folylpolyglutamate synthase/dihydrofolate synthase family protein [Alkaliphilus transvaalensis]
MNFLEAIQFVEKCHSYGTRLSKSEMEMILSYLGNPHLHLKYIHVAGTNGKGSTSSFLHSMLKSEGYQVGLFTSPHLHCYTDRIRINGMNIPQEEFAEIIKMIYDYIDPLMGDQINYPAMFDLMVLLSFTYFTRKQVDYVVLEVGLGGLMDATNVIEDSLISVITPIDIDHIDVLGSDLGQIAHHKAGIIKSNGLVVAHWQLPIADAVIKEVAENKKAKLKILEKDAVSILTQEVKEQSFDLDFSEGLLTNIKIRMIGEHQVYNAALAILALITLRDNNKLQISDEAIYSGVYQNSWAGRLELIQETPLIFIDGAHNLQGASVLSSAIQKYFINKKINFVIGMLSNKDVSGVLNQLIPLCDKVIFTRPKNPKAMDPHLLAQQVSYLGKEVLVAETIQESVHLALEYTSHDEVTIFTGSLYLMGDARKVLLEVIHSNEIAS